MLFIEHNYSGYNRPQAGFDPPIIMLVNVYLNLTHANDLSHHGWTILLVIYIQIFQANSTLHWVLLMLQTPTTSRIDAIRLSCIFNLIVILPWEKFINDVRKIVGGCA